MSHSRPAPRAGSRWSAARHARQVQNARSAQCGCAGGGRPDMAARSEDDRGNKVHRQRTAVPSPRRPGKLGTRLHLTPRGERRTARQREHWLLRNGARRQPASSRQRPNRSWDHVALWLPAPFRTPGGRCSPRKGPGRQASVAKAAVTDRLALCGLATRPAAVCRPLRNEFLLTLIAQRELATEKASWPAPGKSVRGVAPQAPWLDAQRDFVGTCAHEPKRRASFVAIGVATQPSAACARPWA